MANWGDVAAAFGAGFGEQYAAKLNYEDQLKRQREAQQEELKMREAYEMNKEIRVKKEEMQELAGYNEMLKDLGLSAKTIPQAKLMLSYPTYYKKINEAKKKYAMDSVQSALFPQLSSQPTMQDIPMLKDEQMYDRAIKEEERKKALTERQNIYNTYSNYFSEQFGAPITVSNEAQVNLLSKELAYKKGVDELQIKNEAAIRAAENKQIEYIEFAKSLGFIPDKTQSVDVNKYMAERFVRKIDEDAKKRTEEEEKKQEAQDKLYARSNMNDEALLSKIANDVYNNFMLQHLSEEEKNQEIKKRYNAIKQLKRETMSNTKTGVSSFEQQVINILENAVKEK